MSLVPDEAKKQFKEMSEKLNAVSGGLGVRCQLIFSEGIQASTSVSDDVVGDKPKVMLSYGGRSPLRSKTGHSTTNDGGIAANQGLREKITTKIIEGRVYSIEKPFERFQMGVQDDRNIFELVTDVINMNDISKCKEAILNLDLGSKRVRVKLMKPPAVYGLGQAVNCKSVWEEI